ncbi:MAG TPA: BatD family protein [Candidatus Paceibacterota bacterium]|nr:BatD family protein [Verrucomicrobiota bacterium]HSA09651.1 BatD family protein [Candidatus Paceibacterota bacterium]
MRRLSSWITVNPRSRSRHRLRPAFALLTALLWLAPSTLGAASFTATLDRESVTVGESATLTLRYDGGQPKTTPSPPTIPNLQVSGGGTSQSITVINGQFSASISQTFLLTPTQPGDFAIPALTVEIGGQVLSSQPLKLTAVKAPTSAADGAGDKLAFFKLFVPKKEVYVGEILSVEFQVYVRDGLANGEDILQGFDQFSGCPVKAEGVSIIKTAHAQRRRARLGNASYVVATLVTSLSPIKTGPITLGSMDVPLTLQIPLPNQRRRDPFDPFGMFQRMQVEERRVSLSAEPEILKALPLPRENIPATFNGAVGNFTMTVTAGPTNVAAGDPVTVKVALSGRGAFDSLALPEQNAWRDFKTYPPTTKVDTTDPLGLQGTKTFEQVVVPQSPDIKALPPVSFSFFDPDQKSYRTLTQPAIPLVVRPGGAAPAPVVAATTRAAQDNAPPAQDIVHIKPRLGAVAQIAPPLVLRPWFLALQAVPVLAWLSAVLWRRRAEMLANNPRLRRRRQVAQNIRQGLDELRQSAADNKSEAFFATLVRLLQEQIGERLDLPASAITDAVIEEHLRPRGVPETTLAPLQELFQTCNLARYAPIRTSQELAAIIPKLEAVLRDLREMKL